MMTWIEISEDVDGRKTSVLDVPGGILVLVQWQAIAMSMEFVPGDRETLLAWFRNRAT